MNRLAIYISIVFLFLTYYSFTQDVQKSVFNSNRGANSEWLMYNNNSRALYKIITTEAIKLLDERAEKVSKLNSEKDWANYNNDLKSKIFSSLNKFEKTPLNEKITGTIEKETFIVEKILFESHPNFFVTGCLFIPKQRQKPAPTVIYCSGHTELGFRSETYQHVILNLVEKGFIVFAFDPIGQGERLQYLDIKNGKSKVGSSTKEHTFAGVQTLLTGTSLSDYFIWDGVRALDFLETREEVDMNRIGITGRSGGGTQSALIASYDERIYAAAPECYITSFKRLLQSIGPQDAEQNPYHAIKLGFDHPDFLHLRVPKPALIITTTHDFFSQQGARETFAEVQKSYAAFGMLDNLQLTEDFGVHESTKNNRETLYAFFQKHLQLPGNNSDVDVDKFKIEELWVTSTGQLQSSIKSATTFQLNQKYFSKKNISPVQLRNKMAELAGMELNRVLTAAVYTGKFIVDNLETKKYFLENDKKDFALPVYVMSEENSSSNKILVWLSTSCKEQILNNDFAKDLIKDGYTIISADLPGIGELFDAEFSGDGFIKKIPFNYTFGANLVGKSIPGIQAESIDLLMQFVAEENKQQTKIHALIEDELNSSFLHFTSHKNPFNKIALLNPLESNLSLIKTEFYKPNLAYAVVPGSLPYYDFKDLVSLLPENSLKIINTVNDLGETDNAEIKNNDILNFLKQ